MYNDAYPGRPKMEIPGGTIQPDRHVEEQVSDVLSNPKAVEPGAAMIGKIRTLDRGFGFISSPHGTIFFNAHDVTNGSFADLVVGQSVEFEFRREGGDRHRATWVKGR